MISVTILRLAGIMRLQ